MSAPSPSAPSYSQFFGGSGAVTFSVKTTLIYIGGSLGVLALVIVVLMVVLVLCVRPIRRRQQLYLAMQRQRETGVQQVKAEMDAFKPQLRSFPILILQPDSNEIACGKKISLDEGHRFHTTHSGGRDVIKAGLPTTSEGPSGSSGGALPPANTTEDPSRSRGSNRTPAEATPSPEDSSVFSATASPAGSFPAGEVVGVEAPPPDSSHGVATAEESPPIYNPLTHYMTEQQPRLFIAEIVR